MFRARKSFFLLVLLFIMFAISAQERTIGINMFASQVDYSKDRMFADLMKMARDWKVPGNYGNGEFVPVDDKGWPTEDAEIIIWHGNHSMNGSYYIEGYSDQEPNISAGYGGGNIRNFTYRKGKFSLELDYTADGGDGLLLIFRNTGGGVRDLKVMRPLSPGSSQYYPTSSTFTTEAKSLVEPFDVVRFMWPVDGWNGPWQTAWEDRVQPDYCSFNRGSQETGIGWAGKGIAWEYAIQFANETGKDMWVNMPIGADDDYIRQLAALFKENYTVPNGKIYWEYSNEATWDAAHICSNYLKAQAQKEAKVTNIIDYDGVNDINVLTARYYVMRATQMSLIWREVWGDEAMLTRIRPVLSGMLSYNTQLVWGIKFLDNYYNNGDGENVSDPQPVKSFFYGCGASHYTGDDPDSMGEEGYTEFEEFEKRGEEEAALAKIYGLKRVAYEGGVWTDQNHYQLPRIREAMVRYHDLWDRYDGDLLCYYVTTGGEERGTALGFTMDAYDFSTRKYEALDIIKNSDKPEITAGKIVPCEIEGADYSTSSVPWEHPEAAGKETKGGGQLDEWRHYKGYLFRVGSDGTYRFTLEFRNTKNAEIEIMVDGDVLVLENMSGKKSETYTLQLSEGLHGIRIKKNNPGYFLLDKIVIE
jgi:hypothetical protein